MVELLLQVHTGVQEGMRDQVELMISHPKTAALASTQELAEKIAVAIGIPAGAVMCKKLGVDYRLFGGGGLGALTSAKPKPTATGGSSSLPLSHIVPVIA